MNDANCTRERERDRESETCVNMNMNMRHEYECQFGVNRRVRLLTNWFAGNEAWLIANTHERERERERRATRNLSTANEVINGAAPRRRVWREYGNRELNPTLDVTIDRAGRLREPNPRSVWSLPCCQGAATVCNSCNISHAIFQRLNRMIYDRRMRDCPRRRGHWFSVRFVEDRFGSVLYGSMFVSWLSSLLISCEFCGHSPIMFPMPRSPPRPHSALPIELAVPHTKLQVLMLNMLNQRFDYARFILIRCYVLPHRMGHINQWL